MVGVGWERYLIISIVLALSDNLVHNFSVRWLLYVKHVPPTPVEYEHRKAKYLF